MSQGNPYLYAGWFVVDVRLLSFVLGVSLLLTVGTVAMFFRGKTWRDYLAVGLVIYFLAVTVLIVLLNGLANYPVFRIESMFNFP
ncbi:MAG: hypothetical protein HUU55_04020 [Myxococcales bacterium]|nr:hypothetical protein [Myxococcales bacterium]